MLRTAPLLVLLAACPSEEVAPPPPPPSEPPPPAAPAVDPAKLALFGALPSSIDSPTNPGTPEKVRLGRMLYYDTRLSKNHDVACNSCHLLDKNGVDGQPTSTGHKGQKGGRNAPTTLNAAGHLAQFWDGRAADVEAQAKGPPLNPIEMAMKDAAHVETVLKSIPGYAEPFAQAFPGEADAITFDNMGRAIGAFERGLVTPSRWDRFLAGETAVLTAAEVAGFELFVDTGCATCHSGTYVGGGSYQKLGVANPWPDLKDEGRFAVTKNEADRGVFKVPGLRNIAGTGPYFHDGSTATLDLAVKKMAHHQLGKDLTDEQVTSVVAWLGTLTGEIPAAYIEKPELPASGPETPKPDPT